MQDGLPYHLHSIFYKPDIHQFEDTRCSVQGMRVERRLLFLSGNQKLRRAQVAHNKPNNSLNAFFIFYFYLKLWWWFHRLANKFVISLLVQAFRKAV